LVPGKPLVEHQVWNLDVLHENVLAIDFGSWSRNVAGEV
jgi:hypothetical protein